MSVDDVFCLKSDVVDATSATDEHQKDDSSAAHAAELFLESELVESQPQELVSDVPDASEKGNDTVESTAGLASYETKDADAEETTKETTTETTEAVSAADESDGTSQPAISQNMLQDSLSEAKRLPKAAANILRLPYNSIRRRDESDSLRSASSDDVAEVAAAAAVESPSTAAGPGLMSRTLGSITALPSLFTKSTDSASSVATPSPPPRSAPDNKSDKSPNKTRTFFFHRLVGRSPSNSVEVEPTEANKPADDGNWSDFMSSVANTSYQLNSDQLFTVAL